MIRVLAVLTVLLGTQLVADPAAAVLPVTLPSADADWSAARACTREYRPVCARTRFGGRLRTFPNRCEARSAGARVMRPGPCRGRR